MKRSVLFVLVALSALSACKKEVAQTSLPIEPPVATLETTAEKTALTVPEQVTPVTVSPEVPVSPDTTVSVPGVFTKPSNEDIQKALQQAGLYSGKIDGVIGPNTKKAIESFQEQNGLQVDGKVGPKTWEKLQMHLSIPEQPVSPGTTAD